MESLAYIIGVGGIIMLFIIILGALDYYWDSEREDE